MENLIGPCTEFVKCTGGPISRRIEQLRKLSSNLNILKGKRDELAAKQSDIKSLIGLAQEQGKLPLQEVSHWLQNVERVKSEVRDIEESFEQHKTRCFFSNCSSRLKLAKRVVDKTQEVEELRARQFPDRLAIDQPQPALMLNPPTIFGDSTTDRIMKLLMDPKIWKVGVYGMGGVGKTTIMKAVHDKLVAKETFNNVIWVTATKDNMGGIEALQKKIAQRLGDDFLSQVSSNEDKVIRAAMLSHKLKQVGNFVLIIDDLWEKIRLDEVGIPEPDEENKVRKVVVISRQVPVCNSMETQENVEVKCLSEEAAWELFVSKTGEGVHMSNIEYLAKRVSRECAGLPLAIITVGCSMRRKRNTNEWSNALNELKNSRGDDLDMEDKVFNILRFSYDNLKEKAKSCFLYCAFYPEDHEIDTALLIEHWMAEGYTSKGSSTSESCGTWDRETEINKGFHILEELKDACLLDNVKVFARRDNLYVRMHDLVRDLAIRIMRKDLNFISKAGLELRKWPQEEFGKAYKISLVDVNLETFPNQPNCPNLSTLFLGKANLAMQEWKMMIPKMFFSQMLVLQVLDISFFHVMELPESLSELASLRALFLENLKVKKIPSLGKLKELQVLSVRDSWIEETPAGMEALVNLRFLNLDGTRGLKNFDAYLISKLALLEELRMRSSDLLAKSSRIAAICIQGIINLKHLTNLSISFQDFDNYLKAVECIQWNKLKSFHLGMSLSLFYDAYKIFPSGNYNRKLVSIAFLDEKWSSFHFPRDTEVLWFDRCQIPNLSGSQCVKNLGFVKEVYLIQCNFLECRRIKDNVHTLSRDGTIPELLASSEILTLDWYFGLEVFSRGSLSKGCLENLKYLILNECRLKNLLTVNTLQELKNLEFMRIAYCRMMEEIIVEGSSDGSVKTTSEIFLPKLHTLILNHLDELRCMSSNIAWICNSLKVVAVFSCPKLGQLPFNDFPASGIIYGTREWWEGLQWENSTREILQSHFVVPDEKDTEIRALLQPQVNYDV